MRGLIGTLALFAISAQAATPPPSWTDLARKLTGESDEIHDQALDALKKNPDLESTLRSALQGPDKFLALDVVAALPVPALYPDLIRQFDGDATGYYVHALNALVTPENRVEVTKLYRSHLTKPGVSPAVKIALIDTLVRLQSEIPPREMALLLSDPSYEVRESAIAYIRSALRGGEGAGYIALLASPLHDGPFQIRMQVLTLASELSHEFARRLPSGWNTVLEPCSVPERFSPPLTDDERALCAKATAK
jgi:hypothetical protein